MPVIVRWARATCASPTVGRSGASPAAAIDSLAARPSTARERTTSAAPAASTGTVQTTPTAAVTAASAAQVAIAVKHVVPQPVRRCRTIAVAKPAVAASNPLAADGPAGTARKPTTAAYTTAITLSATHGNGSWARREATAPTAAAVATRAPVTMWPYPRVISPDHDSADAPIPAAHSNAVTATIRGARPCLPIGCLRDRAIRIA